MATPQVTSITDGQLPQTLFIQDVTSNSASIHRESHERSLPSTATLKGGQITGQPSPIDTRPMSSSIRTGADLILDLIRTERQQALEDGQRQMAHIQQQHHAESTKRRDAEDMVSYLSTERARYTKEATEVQNTALQARADAIAAQNIASEAEMAADDARSHLMAVQDALQQVGITVSRDDSVTSNTPKIILGTPWLELIPSQTHSSDTPLPDSSNAPDGKPSSSPPTQHLSSPSKFISSLREHINHLRDTLTATQNSYEGLDSQCNQLQSNLRTLDQDRNKFESSKKQTEDNAKVFAQRESKLENEIQWLKIERDDAVKAKVEAATALEEMRRTSAASAVTLKSAFDLRLQDQQRQAEANTEKDRQALENSIEAKTMQIRGLQSRLAQITVTVDEWEGKHDAVTKERDSQKQLQATERQKFKEAFSVQKAQIDDLQKRLEASVSEDVLKGKVSRIEELEKELASLREHHARLSQEKDEAVALVESRDAQIKEMQDMLAVSSSRKLTSECAPKNNPGGSSEAKKARPSKPSTPRGQLQFRAPEERPVAVSTADRRSKQIPGPKKIEKLKSKSSSGTATPGFSADRPMEIDSASSTDVEIVSGPTPIISQGPNAKQKSLRSGLNKAPSGASTSETVNSPTEKTSLKRTADTNDSSTPTTKRPKLFLNSSPSSVKEKVASPSSSSPVSTPLESRSVTSSPIIAKPPPNLKSRKHSAQATSPVSLGGATSSKALARSPNARAPQSATSAEASYAGASDNGEGDVGRGSGSVTSETELAADRTLGAKPRARFLRHGQVKPVASTAGEATGSKKLAEFKNFNPGDVPAQEQPSGSLNCSTTVNAEQPRSAQAAASAKTPPSREASSSSSAKSRPSLLRQFSGKDNLSTPPSNPTPSSSLSTRSGSAVDRNKANSSRDSVSKGLSRPAGTKHILKGPRSSLAMLEVTLESSPKASKSMVGTRASGKVPQGSRATMGTPSTGDIKKGT